MVSTKAYQLLVLLPHLWKMSLPSVLLESSLDFHFLRVMDNFCPTFFDIMLGSTLKAPSLWPRPDGLIL